MSEDILWIVKYILLKTAAQAQTQPNFKTTNETKTMKWELKNWELDITFTSIHSICLWTHKINLDSMVAQWLALSLHSEVVPDLSVWSLHAFFWLDWFYPTLQKHTID